MEFVKNKKAVLFDILFIYFFFMTSLSNYTTGILNRVFTYSDEVLECLAILYLVYCLFKKRSVKIYKIEKLIVVLYALIIVLTGISSLINRAQSLFYSLVDMLIYLKFIVMYFAARFMVTDKKTYEDIFLSLNVIVKVIVTVMFLFIVHDLLFEPVTIIPEYRYGLPAFQLCFGHATGLAIASFICFSIMVVAQGIRYERNTEVFILISLFICFMTLRSKAMASAACALLLYIYFAKLNIKKIWPAGVGSVVATLALGTRQFKHTFNFNGVREMMKPRELLLVDSIELAKNNFPFGTGFGTFASNVSATTYSKFYVELGYENIFGLSRENPWYVSDSFWPIVVAQGGFVAAILFVTVIVAFVFMVLRYLRENKYFLTVGLSVLTYLVISTLAEPAFFHPTVWPLFVIIGMVVCYSSICNE